MRDHHLGSMTSGPGASTDLRKCVWRSRPSGDEQRTSITSVKQRASDWDTEHASGTDEAYCANISRTCVIPSNAVFGKFWSSARRHSSRSSVSNATPTMLCAGSRTFSTGENIMVVIFFTTPGRRKRSRACVSLLKSRCREMVFA